MIIVHIILYRCLLVISAFGVGSAFLLGFGYSIYVSVICPSIPYIVEPKSIGTGFVVFASMKNAGLSFWLMVVGEIHDSQAASMTICDSQFYLFHGSYRASHCKLIVDSW
ncbi:unnamed protein product [Blepharisma stoltei]|uniref:Uncharacterized protein n=1 Tax=Blepharisma stoltei TaxID=1481888 RepID=A0AAU9KAM4_9CILI|nr:unnamed protein product [Blepharisma stoltei]